MNEAKRVFGDTYESPKTRLEWAQLSHQLGIESIHIAERDTQIDRRRRRANEMFSTWSMDGLLTEASDPLHFAWGTHESHIPEQTKGHISHQGNVCSLHGKVRSVSTKIHSVTPKYGAFHGFVIPHIEAFSLGEYLSIHEDNKLIYQPTILFAYQPCDDAVLSLHDAQAAAWQTETLENYLMMDIEEGTDALGVVLHMRGQDHYQWFGSEVSTSDFKAFPHNNATSLQVVAGVISGIAYIVNNPNQGILEPEDLPYETMIELAKPYLGNLFSHREAFPTKTLKLRSGEHWYFNELIVKDDQ